MRSGWSRWQRFKRWWLKSEERHRRCLARIVQLERELFPEWFPQRPPRQLPYRLVETNFTQIQRAPYELKRDIEQALFFGPKKTPPGGPGALEYYMRTGRFLTEDA